MAHTMLIFIQVTGGLAMKIGKWSRRSVLVWLLVHLVWGVSNDM